jgi:hypothetical protein
MKKAGQRGALYLAFCKDNGLGNRLEIARRIVREKGYIVGMNRSVWAQTLQIQRQVYNLVVKGTKPVPASVWAGLFALGFSLDWFVRGEGTPLRESDGRIPKLVEEVARSISEEGLQNKRVGGTVKMELKKVSEESATHMNRASRKLLDLLVHKSSTRRNR